jgi:D-serine dehydratase
MGMRRSGSASFFIETNNTSAPIVIIKIFPRVTAPKAVVEKKLKNVSIIKESSLQQYLAFMNGHRVIPNHEDFIIKPVKIDSIIET